MRKFAKIQTKSRSIMLAEQLTELIINGQLADGDLLPPENKLCESFGVSRSVLREAVRVLAAKGLLEVRQGYGTHVRAPKDDIPEEALNNYLQTNPLSLLQLLEVRVPLEIEIAKLAAQRRKEKHLARMERSLASMQDHAGDVEALANDDDEFHQAVVDATGNPIFRIVIRSLLKYLHLSRRLTISHFGRQIVVDGHQAIYEAIRNQESAAAAENMAAHMDLTFKNLKLIEEQVSEALAG